jgi:hypothetical protein
VPQSIREENSRAAFLARISFHAKNSRHLRMYAHHLQLRNNNFLFYFTSLHFQMRRRQILVKRGMDEYSFKLTAPKAGVCIVEIESRYELTRGGVRVPFCGLNLGLISVAFR